MPPYSVLYSPPLQIPLLIQVQERPMKREGASTHLSECCVVSWTVMCEKPDTLSRVGLRHVHTHPPPPLQRKKCNLVCCCAWNSALESQPQDRMWQRILLLNELTLHFIVVWVRVDLKSLLLRLSFQFHGN